MRRWGEKIKVRNKGREDHQIQLELKPLQPIWLPIQTQTNIQPTLQINQTITTHSATHPNTNKYSANTPNKSNHSTTTQKHPNLAESRGKTRGVKKVSKGDENCVEKLKKQPNFYAREG